MKPGQVDRGILSYPWTIAEQGVERAVGIIKQELCADSLYVSVNYHSGRLFQPLSEKKVYMRHEATYAFEPDAARYPEGMSPMTDEGIAGRHTQLAIRQACTEQGVAYRAWMVGLHNSSLGRARNDCCIRNAFGDIYDFALCPSHPVARAYVVGLTEDVCANLDPASLIVEAHGFPGFVHGHHHEKVLGSLGPVCEYLLSLCFCDFCTQAAVRAGMDVVRLQANVREKIGYLIEQERGAIGADFTQGELACLLLEDDDLYRYTRDRIDTVTSLVEEQAHIARKYGKKIVVMPSYISSYSWMEGTSLSRLSAVADGFFALSYFAQPDRVKADLEWIRLFAGDVPCIAGLYGGSPFTSSEGGLRACVHAALSAGASAVAYYNWSLLSRTRLEWIGAVNRSIRC